MPVLTRSQKRPADEAPEIDDSEKEKKPGSGAHSTAQASVKKKEKKARQKATERKCAPPEKQAAVHAKDAAQHQAKRTVLVQYSTRTILVQYSYCTVPYSRSLPSTGVLEYSTLD